MKSTNMVACELAPAAANGSAIARISATISQGRALLESAATVPEIRGAEAFAQTARTLAKAARIGREAVNSAARVALDARRKLGAALISMQERGELPPPGRPKLSYRPTLFNLRDLGLTRDRASLYRQEASVPAAVYEEWCRRTIQREDGFLEAKDLRRLARKLADSGSDLPPQLDLPVVKRQIRRYLTGFARRLGPHAARCLPGLLLALVDEFEGWRVARNAAFRRTQSKPEAPADGGACYEI